MTTTVLAWVSKLTEGETDKFDGRSDLTEVKLGPTRSLRLVYLYLASHEDVAGRGQDPEGIGRRSKRKRAFL